MAGRLLTGLLLPGFVFPGGKLFERLGKAEGNQGKGQGDHAGGCLLGCVFGSAQPEQKDSGANTGADQGDKPSFFLQIFHGATPGVQVHVWGRMRVQGGALGSLTGCQ